MEIPLIDFDYSSAALVGGLALLRVMSMFVIAPIFGSLALPRRTRVAAAIVVVLALMPHLATEPTPPFEITHLAVAALGEAALGAAAGLSAGLIFAAVEAAGQLLGVPMGLGFASVVDPATNLSSVVTSRYLGIIVGLLFLSMDGHHLLLRLIAESFALLPPGKVVPAALAGPSIARSASIMFTGMVQMAAPVVIVLLGVMLGMGFLARIAQRVNLFVLSFAVSIAVGLITLRATLPDIVAWMGGMLRQIETIAVQSMSAFA